MFKLWSKIKDGMHAPALCRLNLFLDDSLSYLNYTLSMLLFAYICLFELK